MSQFQVVAPVEHPPTMPLPEDQKRQQASENSCGNQADHSNPALAEVQQAQSIFCRLWIIVNEIFLIYRDREIGARSLAFALGKYHKLLELVGNLPKPMTRQDQTPHWVLIFQYVFSANRAILPKREHEFVSRVGPRSLSGSGDPRLVSAISRPPAPLSEFFQSTV